MTPTAIDSLLSLATRGASVLLAFQPAATPGGGGHHGPSGGGSPGGGITQMLMLPAIFFFVWFFMLRPMKQQQKEQEDVQKSLRKGDKVVTNSGMIGTVYEVLDKEIVIELAEKVRVRFTRESVTKKYETETASAKPADADKK